MDFMKVIDQTVREIKREVNLKVLKVPEIEQKVLDATDNEPWGPHGTALAEIAQATKKFSECQMVMNVLWTRLTETGKDWRHAYKALAVIEYLVANGSERAVDDIVEHTFQISSLTSFEYVEPSGKDMGINVRKKAENIVALLNDKDKIQEARNKASANREKYVGLSSTGITFKSGPSSFSSSGYQSGDRYRGSSGTRDADSFRDSYRDGDLYRDETNEQGSLGKSRRGFTSENQRKSSTRYGSKDHNNISLKPSTKSNDSANYGTIPSHSSSAPSAKYEDDFDDFDPRGISTTKAAAASPNQVDLFGQGIVGDLMDAPTSTPTEKSTISSEVDLFADASFVSAPPHIEKAPSSQTKAEVDLFDSQTAVPSVSETVGLFAAPDPVVLPETNSTSSAAAPINSQIEDPFAAVPLNSFDGTDIFGAFTSHSDSVSSEPSQNPVSGNHTNLGGKSTAESKTSAKKDTFQVKSGIWADSLSRGLIDLNISAPKKVSLVDVGVVGGLSEGSDEREKGAPTYYMGRAMGAGSSLGRPGSQSIGDDFFSSLGGEQYQYGGFQK